MWPATFGTSASAGAAKPVGECFHDRTEYESERCRTSIRATCSGVDRVCWLHQARSRWAARLPRWVHHALDQLPPLPAPGGRAERPTDRVVLLHRWIEPLRLVERALVSLGELIVELL